ncbi:hypothetical protein F5Y14DRAFT_440011 [Nemania sp. NC0429]|nr:hypothetical protein F5Y14DRAFT_440011 [Nemania sp. NC0429]
MPCTAARLTDHTRGSDTVDYCIFFEPGPDEATRIDEVRGRWEYINHTDYRPLRRRPVVLGVECSKPSGGFRKRGIAARRLANRAVVPAAIPFLPSLIIQGNDWYFTASTRFGRRTILWSRQPIGSTGSVIGIFQIVRALRHVAWI